MPTCSFSGQKIPPGTGIMYVQKDGKILYFKSSKEKKNFLKLKRIPRKVKWTQAYRKENQKGEFGAAKKETKPVKETSKKEETKVEAKPAAKEPTQEAAAKEQAQEPVKEESKQEPKAQESKEAAQ